VLQTPSLPTPGKNPASAHGFGVLKGKGFGEGITPPQKFFSVFLSEDKK